MKSLSGDLTRWLERVISGGMPENPDLETQLRVRVMNIISILTIFVCFIFASDALKRGKSSIAIAAYSVSAIFFLTQIYWRKTRHYEQIIYFWIASTGLLFIYLYLTGGVSHTGHLWVFVFPIVAAFLLGPRGGAIAIFAFLSSLLLLWAAQLLQGSNVHSGNFTIRFVTSFSILSFSACLYEYVRARTQRQLITSNLELDKQITKLKEAEEALKKNQDELERRVESRTVELKKANEELQEEILKHRKTEETLNEKNDFQESMIRTMVEGLCAFNETPEPPFVHVYIWNDRMREITGYTMEEINRPAWYRTLYPDPSRQQRVIEQLADLRGGKNLDNKETVITRADGEERTLLVSTLRLTSRDGNNHVLGFISDITERKRAEEEQMKLQQQLKQAEKMETIGKLAAGVAHDLNNILSGLVSYPDLLLADLPENNPLHRPISIIQQSGAKAAAVVQDLLTLSRQGMAEKKIVNMNTIIDDYLHTPEYDQLRLNHPQVHLEVDLREDLLNMQGSSLYLSKALMNLLHNAFEANLVEGSARISTRNCYKDQPTEAYERISEGEYVVLSVSDTGIGIDAEDQRKIFEPFFTKKKLGRSGTGLGMTLVWSTVKDHGGFIDIHSAEGRGSSFDLYLPATRQKTSEREKSLALEDCRGSESVLVVDDIPDQREIASVMLQKLGYNVQAVASGEAAIEYLKENNADILILDMIMDPGLDGCETYQRIIQDHPKQKAIIASGFSESERVREAQRLGAGEYIRKPYTLEKIARALRAELDR